jgi:hypothetical protein
MAAFRAAERFVLRHRWAFAARVNTPATAKQRTIVTCAAPPQKVPNQLDDFAAANL